MMNEILPSNLREVIDNVAQALAALERIGGPNTRSEISLLVPEAERFAVLGPPDGHFFVHAPNGTVYKLPYGRIELARHTITFIGSAEVGGSGALSDDPMSRLQLLSAQN